MSSCTKILHHLLNSHPLMAHITAIFSSCLFFIMELDNPYKTSYQNIRFLSMEVRFIIRKVWKYHFYAHKLSMDDLGANNGLLNTYLH